MTLAIETLVHPMASTAAEGAVIELSITGRQDRSALDIDFTELLRHSRHVSELATDFLLLSAVVYACDKIVDREDATMSEDRWTRALDIHIPLRHPAPWQAVADELAECVGFLTGDVWRFSFSEETREIIQRRRGRRRVRRIQLPQPVDAVCLFSGGLDSYVGAIDWLADHPNQRLMLVGHYDRHLKGPKHDQEALATILRRHFPGRFEALHGRIGVMPAGDDINLRSRSFVFIGLAAFFAAQLGPQTPILIPENGPIALNIPLTPSRRGSCSTRTVHPFFIDSITRILQNVGLNHPVTNPLRLKTKGEILTACRVPAALKAGYGLSRSCAKGGHKSSWHNRNARQCGRCVPCLFRRAALAKAGLDDEPYGIDVLSSREPDLDFLSLLSFVRRKESERDIRKALVTHGVVSSSELQEYAGVIMRMRDEVEQWLRQKAPESIKDLAALT